MGEDLGEDLWQEGRGDLLGEELWGKGRGISGEES